MNLKNASILVIDDDPDVLTAVRLLLKTEAADVVTEKNPENMRSILSKRSFDLILLDMNFNSSINTGNEGLVLAPEDQGVRVDGGSHYDYGIWRYRSGSEVVEGGGRRFCGQALA